MKKISIILFAAFAALTVSCQKEAPVTTPASTGVQKTFSVVAPETKTALDGLSVLWSEGDEINVIAATSGNQYTFTLSGGAGTSNASFSGTLDEEDAEETAFYAVYPNVAIRPESLAEDKIELDASLGTEQTAVKGSFDPNFALMTAAVGEDGKLSFRHGVAYFKITVGNENVKSVNLKTSNTRFAGRPVIVASTGDFSAIESAKDNITLSASEGDLEYGATYYIPVPVKNSTLKTLTVTYKFSDGTIDKSMSTDKKASVKLAVGSVYDLGTPTFSLLPAIIADDYKIEADATSGSIAYEIENPVADGVLSAEVIDDAEWITVGEVTEDAVYYTCTANTGAAREATIRLTYTYDTAETATKDVVITQKTGDDTLPEDHVWDFSSDEWVSALTAAGNANTDITGWNMTVDGLTWISTQKSKWNVSGDVYYIQAGGKGTNADRVFKLSVEKSGTLSVWASNTGNSEDLTRMVTVEAGGETQSIAGGYASTDGAHQVDFEIAAGDVAVYPTINALRFYKIEFHSN